MWIEVFRTGTWTDAAGNTKEWTEEDLDKIANSYNPSEHSAPIVIGHPKDNAPAYGWVEALKREGDKLLAKIKPTVEEFVDWVRKGLYKKVSISLYPDMSLRHIGFLGAVPPAVKGLQPPQFLESSFEEWTMTHDFTSQVRLNRKGVSHARSLISQGKVNKSSPWTISAEDENKLLGDDNWDEYGKWFLGVDPGENPETKAHFKYPFGKNGQVFRSALIAIRQRAAQQGADDIFEAAGKLLEMIDKEETNMEERIKELEAKLSEKDKQIQEFLEREKKRDEEVARLSNELEKARRTQRRMEFESFCEGLIMEGKLTPAGKATAIELLEIADSVGEYEFADGKKPAIDIVKNFLQSLPAQVLYGEYAKKERAAAGDWEKAVDEYMARHKVDYKTAIIEVSKRNPELFVGR